MEIKIYSEVQIDKNLEEHIKKKIEKLEKFVFNEGTISFYIKKEGHQYTSEINIHSKHINIFMKEQAENIKESVETLFDRIKRKLRQAHDKIIDRSHKKTNINAVNSE